MIVNFQTFHTNLKKKEEEVVEEVSNNSNKNSKEVEVVFYFKNAQASFVKKLQIRINSQLFHTVSASIPINQVYIVSGNFPKPNSGDHKIKFDLKMPAKGFFDSVDEEFNLTKHGNYILIDCVETTLDDGSSESNISFSQQTKPFTFGSDETLGEKKKRS